MSGEDKRWGPSDNGLSPPGKQPPGRRPPILPIRKGYSYEIFIGTGHKGFRPLVTALLAALLIGSGAAGAFWWSCQKQSEGYDLFKLSRVDGFVRLNQIPREALDPVVGQENVDAADAAGSDTIQSRRGRFSHADRCGRWSRGRSSRSFRPRRSLSFI